MPLTLRIGVFSACLLPFAWLIYAIATNALGPDPAEAVMHVTGEWSLRMLALTLLISPLRQWTGWAPWMKLRRMLGLYAFFYACLHLFSFLQLFIGWTPARIWEELVERPYITAGANLHPRYAAPPEATLAAVAPPGISNRVGRLPAPAVAGALGYR